MAKSRDALDDHGQPRNRRFNALRRADRGIAEMLGLVRGVLADGEVTEREARVLANWTQANPDVVADWPARAIARRLDQIFEDGRVDDDEREQLASFLERVLGGDPLAVTGAQLATALPLDSPPPSIKVSRHTFVFTGEFALGPRRIVEDIIRQKGGRAEPRVTKRTNYLVIGTVGSRDWIQSTHGRKIEKAVDYRDRRGVGVAIVSEDHWAMEVW